MASISVFKLSRKGWQSAAWTLFASVQYGWHISSLNQIQQALSCPPGPELAPFQSGFITSCIPMNEFTFSIVTSAFTVGGLFGNLAGHHILDRVGHKVSICIHALIICFGSALMTVSSSVSLLVISRILIGAGSGVGLHVVPSYLSDISHPQAKGNVGAFSQLGMVLGTFLTQACGLAFASPKMWRVIPLIGFASSLAHFLLSFLAIDSPVWLSRKLYHIDAQSTAALLWGHGSHLTTTVLNAQREREPLLSQNAKIEWPSPPKFGELFKPPLGLPLAGACLSMIAQQWSGINAILSYSNNIFSKVVPGGAPYLSLSMTALNALMSIPPIYLVGLVGHRALVNISTFGAALSLVGVGYGLNNNHVVITCVAAFTFVASFGLGLGPVPFAIITAVSPSNATSSFSNIAHSLHWLSNFSVSIGFHPLRKLLAKADARHDGRIFYLFAAVLVVTHLAWTWTRKGR
ncbi:general substrate transporter [Ramaria rubella]|nr:general substrate transporter [Ramaria rubella]